MPLPAKLLSVPPVTVTLLAVKSVLFSLRVKVSVVLALSARNVVCAASMVTVGVTASTVTRRISLNERLPALSVCRALICVCPLPSAATSASVRV